jgi:predicted metalloprotease with PDZ domain
MTRLLCRALGLTVFFLVSVSGPAARSAPARPIELSVDATEAPRKLLHARLVIPVAPGPLTLYYPKWIPGEHSPSGPILELSGLKLRAGGKRLPWRRDDVHLYAFHCTVPDGADTLEVTLDYLGPSAKEGFTSGASITDRLAILNWNQVLLYPKGRPVSELQVRARLALPRGWKFGTALPIESTGEAHTQFQAVSLTRLVDSPVLCGAHLRELPLGPAQGPPHFLVLACDSATGLELPADLRSQYERLVAEAGALFGARHYRSYRFLVAMSDHIRPDGIEHHESSDNRVPERFLRDDTYRKQWEMWLLPHEYVHSWNGKYRRPDGLMTADFQQPMKTRLLWVYEGLTEYLGFVLAARSGLMTPELSRENWAVIADWAKNQRGRAWRPLEDTATAAPYLYYARAEWASRRRGVDFYDEGALLWLDVDTLIREKTGGKKSLDDFCRAFFGGKDGPPEVKPYTFDDLVRALNDVAAHDWKGFLERRLTTTRSEPPLDGLERGGWKVVYRDKPGELLKTRDSDDKTFTLTSSLGLLLKEDGQIIDVVPDSPADKAGLGPGMKVLGVNQRRMTADRLREAVAATHKGRAKLTLLLENQEHFRTVTLDYAGGQRYPHLERFKGKSDVLGDILRPLLGK